MACLVLYSVRRAGAVAEIPRIRRGVTAPQRFPFAFFPAPRRSLNNSHIARIFAGNFYHANVSPAETRALIIICSCITIRLPRERSRRGYRACMEQLCFSLIVYVVAQFRVSLSPKFAICVDGCKVPYHGGFPRCEFYARPTIPLFHSRPEIGLRRRKRERSNPRAADPRRNTLGRRRTRRYDPDS